MIDQSYLGMYTVWIIVFSCSADFDLVGRSNTVRSSSRRGLIALVRSWSGSSVLAPVYSYSLVEFKDGIVFFSVQHPGRNANEKLKTLRLKQQCPGSWLLVTNYIGRLACKRIEWRASSVWQWHTWPVDLSSCTSILFILHVAIDSVVCGRGPFTSYIWLTSPPSMTLYIYMWGFLCFLTSLRSWTLHFIFFNQDGKVCFSTLNYHDSPILDLELRNRTSYTSN